MAILPASMTEGPLADLSVVEFGEGTSGPYAAKLLGDFGARVVKIESPAGDASRQRGPFPDGIPNSEASGLFLYLNTNKYGVVIDVEQEAGRAALNKLLETADVFVTNQSAAFLQRTGLDPAHLRQRYPGLIVVSISPFGPGGPWGNFKSDEIVAYATSGMAYSTPGMPDASADLYGERPLRPNCFASQTVAGLAAAVAAMTAIIGRRLSNQGCLIEVSEQAASASMQIRDTTAASYTGNPYNRLLNPHTIGRMPNFYLPCKDGYVTIAAPMDIHWDRLVEAMGSPAWAVAPEFSSTLARIDNWIELRLKLIEWTMTIEGDAIYELAEKYQLPFFPFYSVRKLLASDQVEARDSVIDFSVGRHGAKMPGAPFRMRRSPWEFRQPAPRLGEHNSAILDSLLEGAV